MNNITAKIQISTILAYSAKKKKTNIPAECSVIKPETNSDSASAKSKGALLVSAIDPIKKIINKGNKGNKKYVIFCASTLLVRLRLFVSNTTNNITELNINSQLISWAVLLNEPKKAYFELADQPANKIPYVDSEDTANMYNIPKFKSAIVRPGLYGTTAYPNSENINVIIGPKKNNIKLA